MSTVILPNRARTSILNNLHEVLKNGYVIFLSANVPIFISITKDSQKLESIHVTLSNNSPMYKASFEQENILRIVIDDIATLYLYSGKKSVATSISGSSYKLGAILNPTKINHLSRLILNAILRLPRKYTYYLVLGIQDQAFEKYDYDVTPNISLVGTDINSTTGGRLYEQYLAAWGEKVNTGKSLTVKGTVYGYLPVSNSSIYGPTESKIKQNIEEVISWLISFGILSSRPKTSIRDINVKVFTRSNKHHVLLDLPLETKILINSLALTSEFKQKLSYITNKHSLTNLLSKHLSQIRNILQLTSVVPKIQEHKNKVVNSLRIYNLSFMQANPMVNLVLLFAAFEAIEGEKETNKKKDLLSTKISSLIATDLNDLDDIVNCIVKAYGYRNDFIHEGDINSTMRHDLESNIEKLQLIYSRLIRKELMLLSATP